MFVCVHINLEIYIELSEFTYPDFLGYKVAKTPTLKSSTLDFKWALTFGD